MITFIYYVALNYKFGIISRKIAFVFFLSKIFRSFTFWYLKLSTIA